MKGASITWDPADARHLVVTASALDAYTQINRLLTALGDDGLTDDGQADNAADTSADTSATGEAQAIGFDAVGLAEGGGPKPEPRLGSP